MFIIFGAYLLYMRDLQLANTGFESVSTATRDLGVAFIMLGIPIIGFTVFGVVATFRERIVLLKVVCIKNRQGVMIEKQTFQGHCLRYFLIFSFNLEMLSLSL